MGFRARTIVAVLQGVENLSICESIRTVGQSRAQLSILFRDAANNLANGPGVQANDRVRQFFPQLLGRRGQIVFSVDNLNKACCRTTPFYRLPASPHCLCSMRYPAQLLPPSYICEAMRMIVFGEPPSALTVLGSGGLAMFYILAASWFFTRSANTPCSRD
jgi:hypothetical protein